MNGDAVNFLLRSQQRLIEVQERQAVALEQIAAAVQHLADTMTPTGLEQLARKSGPLLRAVIEEMDEK
jgi:hypothetical protein